MQVRMAMVQRRSLTAIVCTGVLLLAGCASVTQQSVVGGRSTSQADVLRDVDAYLEQARTDWGIPGMAIAIVHDDSVIYARGFGVRTVGQDEPVDMNTLFAIGSNTKAFTAAAIGTLVEDGSMSWDDPMTKHLPGFLLYDPYVTRELTIRDALSHRSGLGRRGDMIWYGTPFDRSEVIRRVRFLEPNSSFRSEFGYQNIMFIAAGEAAARAGGQSWDELIQQRLLQPLGMQRSNTSVTDLRGVANVATPHTQHDGRTVAIAWRNIDNAGPAGSINSSVAEMTNWLRMLLADGMLDGRRILSAATIREMMTPHTIAGGGVDSLFPMRHFSTYGLGVGLSDYYGRLLVSHSGGIDGMLSTVALMPEEDLGIVLLTNTDAHAAYMPLTHYILDAFIGAPRRDWSAEALESAREARAAAAEAEAAAAARRVAGTQPSRTLADYVGTYESDLYGTAEVALEDGALVLHRFETMRIPLEHWHYDTFRGTWDDAVLGTGMVTFELSSAGQVSGFELQGVGEFSRVQETAGLR